ncbi:hypothetical protein K525DRAFT_290965 [Schizophyllum commune Loenen D]|nr:hypothetical protein K525DRAFT_290965 [Schizophyllum commune Loenen D]
MPWTRTTKGSSTTQRKSTKSTRTYTSRKNNGLGMSQASWRRMVINDALEEADELEAEFQARKRAREEEEEAPTSASISASISAPKEKENAATIRSVLPPAKRQRVTRASKPAPMWTPHDGTASTPSTTPTATTSTRTTRSAAASTSTSTAASSRNSSTVPPRYTSTAPSRSASTTIASCARPTQQDMSAIPDALKPKIPVLFPEVFDPVLYAKFAAMYKAGMLPGYSPAGAGGVAAGGSAAAPVAAVPSAGSSVAPAPQPARST